MKNTKKTTVTVVKIVNASDMEATAFRKAAKLLEEVVLNNPDFWYDVSIRYPKWSCKDGMPFGMYKALVLGGKDKFESVKDNDIRVRVEFYYSRRSVVGYTYPTTWFTWVNRNLFKGFDLGDIGGNIFHEAMHNMGLDHPGTDRNSIVYQAGYLARKYIKEELDIAPVRTIYRRGFFSRIKSFFRRLV